jgi:DNA mismatch repair protein MutS
MPAELTPMMQQYQTFKQAHPDALLLFRMGDFYETFFEDAKEASRLLGLTLTRRNNGKADAVPLAGLPYHALDTYLARLVKAGRKVAICEQMEAPTKGKSVVRREVVQVVSPGTVLAEDLLDHRRNNHLVSLRVDKETAGLAVLDLSTGSFRVLERPREDLWDLLEQLAPAEILAPVSWCEEGTGLVAERMPGILVTPLEDWTFGTNYAREKLVGHFKTHSLEGFGCEDLDVAIGAAGAALAYVIENQKGAVPHITRIAVDRAGAHVVLDGVTQRNLELTASIRDGGREGTLISVVDRTRTSPGARMMRSWLFNPLTDVASIRARHDAVEELSTQEGLRSDLREALRDVSDLERLMSRVCCGRATPRDVVALGKSCACSPVIRSMLEAAKSKPLAAVRDTGLPDLGSLTDEIERALVDDSPVQIAEGGVIRGGYNEQLDTLREAASGGRSWVAALQSQEREATGIPSLKVGFNRAFGYYIEVTKANIDRVPESYDRKQTLVNAERFITPDLKAWEAKILGADDEAKEIEKALFYALRERVADRVADVQATAEAFSTVDVLASLAEVAADAGYVRPDVDEGTAIDIEGGRHPVVEALLPAGAFVSNDVHINGDRDQVLIITGPNMAGKSTILRQVGLIVLLAQVGSFVPARSARIGVTDRIFTRVGASDNVARGESTFLVEMNEAANILNNATPRSLVLLDEIGRGTSTFDGLSIAWAMTEYLHNAPIRPRSLFATHYHELTELEEILPRVKNFSVAVRERGGEVVFLHTLVAGGCDHSYGIEVARLAGMPRELIDRAKFILARLEQNDLSMSDSVVRRSRKSRQAEGQISLFGSEPGPSTHPVLEALKDLDVEGMTPVEAIVKLSELKRKAAEAAGTNGTPRGETLR